MGTVYEYLLNIAAEDAVKKLTPFLRLRKKDFIEEAVIYGYVKKTNKLKQHFLGYKYIYSIKIYKGTTGRNSFRPIFYGHIEQTGTGSKITGKFGLHLSTVLFYVITFAILLNPVVYKYINGVPMTYEYIVRLLTHSIIAIIGVIIISVIGYFTSCRNKTEIIKLLDNIF